MDQARMSSSKDKAKSKMVPGSKERGEIVVNPDEPVHESWSKLSPYDFERDRLEFNPYDFGQHTSCDSRFYCKMHENRGGPTPRSAWALARGLGPKPH